MDGGGANCRVGEMAWELYHHRRRRRIRILKLIGEEHLSATVAMGWEIFELPSSCHHCRHHLQLDFDAADPSASMEMSLQICPRHRLCSTRRRRRAIGQALVQAWTPIIPIRSPMPIMHRRGICTLESQRDQRGFQHYCWCCRRRRRNTAPWLDV